MKGTLFSADFIKDGAGNLRLLEVNTDTSIVPEESNNIDWTGFLNTLQSSSIDTLDVVYKPILHNTIINSLSSSVASTGGFITDFNLHPEDVNTIYPSNVADTGTNFILRIAYDESAIFDSTYAKSRINTFNLFTSGGYNDSVSGHYYSSSADGVTNTLVYEINPDNIPDVAVKDTTELFNPIKFYKIGSEVEGETAEIRWTSFVDQIKTDSTIIEQYHYNSSSLTADNKLTSIRSFHIVYGSNLDLVDLHSYKVPTLFDLPSYETLGVNSGSYVNELGANHYYEFTTNMIKPDSAGILSTHKIQMADGTYQAIADVEVGDAIASYYISGSPSVETDFIASNWSYEGSEFPSGSYLTSSVAVFKDTEYLKYGATIEYVVDNDSLFSGVSKQYLVYDSSSNSTSFKHATEVNPDTDYFYDLDGTIIDIDEINLYITTDTSLQTVELDVEDTDTYIISGSTAFNAVVSHNAPCFVAGTKITLKDGTLVNIEDVKVGDLALTYNHESNEVEYKEVVQVLSKKVDRTVKYIFNTGATLECTVDHPLYTNSGKYASYRPDISISKYKLDVGQIEVGTEIMVEDKTFVTITSIEELSEKKTVYNLNEVVDNHNFFANSLLAHNRCFSEDSLVEMFDGSYKSISKIEEGDIVKSVRNGKDVQGKVTKTLKHPVHQVVSVVDLNGKYADADHPIFINGGWTPISSVAPTTLAFIDYFYNLEVDGDVEDSEHNYIVSGFIASGLGDNKELNEKYTRQSLTNLTHL